CLVRATEFDYADFGTGSGSVVDELLHQGSSRYASFIRRVTQSGFVRHEVPAEVRHGRRYVTYLRKSLPPLEFEYSKVEIQDEVRELDDDSIENLPIGVDGGVYQWVDLDSEGLPGILSKQGGAWKYKPNLGGGTFGAVHTLHTQPSLFVQASGGEQLLDLSGDGHLDVVAFAGAMPGFYERTDDGDWAPFVPLSDVPNIAWDDPNMRLVDLNGDGHADVLITEHDVFTWYPSRCEEGLDGARHVAQGADEEQGPAIVFANGEESIYLADMSGDGLTDLVRIRNGEVCYWPNLGYGHFGPKVAMDDAPWFDHDDRFDQARIRLVDVDGSGTVDILYLGHDGVKIYYNQAGNGWSEARALNAYVRLDQLTTVATADLLGNGTACLVWSSRGPADAESPLRYVDLTGGKKPNLLTKSINNLGAETHIHYAPSTKFYVEDKL
ncbi:MAG: toxin TcdB middle/N-terminal domain-containing protein, partial [Nannocystaceae bacterium]